jgi:hypothetical protein
MKKLTSLIVVVSMALPSFAQAATLEASGKVAVNRNPVSGSTQVKAGDMISVAPGSSAQIVYGPGCREAVAPGTVGYVKGNSLKDGPSCGTGGANQASAANAGSGAAGGAGAGAAGAAGGAAAGAAGLAVGAAVIGIGAGAFILASKSKNLPATPAPASP